MASEAKKNARIIPEKLRKFVDDGLEQCATLLARLKFSPNFVTILAFLSGAAAGIFYAFGKPLEAALFILLCGSFDVMDGKIAKQRNQSSLFGAIFDSTLDRYSEFFIYLGLAYHFQDHWALWVTLFALLGSTMVSYTRARAEGLGFECRIGIMQRAERLALLALAGLLGTLFNIFEPLAIGILIVIAVVSNFTAWQRTYYVLKVEKKKRLDT